MLLFLILIAYEPERTHLPLDSIAIHGVVAKFQHKWGIEKYQMYVSIELPYI